VPILSAKQYLMLSKKWLEKLQKIRPLTIYTFSIVHNLGLHLYSLYTFVILFKVLLVRGVSTNSGFYFDEPIVRGALFWFYLSKYYEYTDTMILYANKKQPIFLQKFHHVGATFVWHLGYVYQFEGIYFASLVNSGIHAVMYFYYFLSMFENVRPFINRYKVYITCAQVGQLVSGFVTIPWYYYGKESITNQRVIIVFDIYLGFLIILFLQFMVKNYFSKRTN
jgi:hypothetical protein